MHLFAKVATRLPEMMFLCRATLFPGDIILIKPGRDSSPSAARSRAFDQNSESWPASGLARRAR